MNLSTIASLLLSTTFNEVKGETPVITHLSTIPAFTNVENKIPNFRDLFKKTDYDAKMSEMEKNILVLLLITTLRVIHLM